MAGTELLTAALGYAERGIRVFPLHWIENGSCSCRTKCGSAGKHPLVPTGFKAATTEYTQIAEWWEKWPKANIGIATGKESNLWVLDLDAKRSVPLDGGAVMPEGEHSLRRLQHEYADLPATTLIDTPSGGMHFWFAFPEREGNWGNRSGLRPSIDIRGEGGYVVGPPSVGVSGRQYTLILDVDLKDVPDWLLDLTLQEQSGTAKAAGFTEGEKVVEGQGRHEALFKYAARLRGVNGLESDEILGALLVANSKYIEPPVEHSYLERLAREIPAKYRVNEAPPEFVLDVKPRTKEEPLPEIEEGQDMPIKLIDLFLNPPPKPEPLIDGILNQGEAAVIGSRPNLGKSWAAFQMALAVATGEKFLGKYPTHKSTVLYLDEEGSAWNDHERLRMLAAGMELGSVEDVPLYLSIGKGIRLDKPEGILVVARMAERFRPGLIIFDALVRFHRGDENSAQEMSAFFAIAKQLQVNYGTATAWLHHLRKPSVHDDPDDPAALFRGSGDIQGWADSTFVLRPYIKGDKGDIEFINTKQRNTFRSDPFITHLMVDNESDIARIEYKAMVDGPIGATGKQDQILTAIQTLGLRQAKPTALALAVETDLSPRSVQEVVKGMVQAMLLEEYEFTTDKGKRERAYRVRQDG